MSEQQAPDARVQELDELTGASRAVKQMFESDAYLNLAFYSGRQWTGWDGMRVFDVNVDDLPEQVVDNRIQPFIRTEIAKMTKTRPKYVGVPRTSTDQDISAAKYAELALDDVWKQQDLSRKLRMALLWARITGAGFWKIWWDPSLGKRTPVLTFAKDHPTQPGKLVRDGYGAPWNVNEPTPPEMGPTQQTEIATGEICVEPRSFFHLFPSPNCGEEGLEGADWIIEEAVYSRHWMTQHFPEHAESVQYDTDPQPGMLEGRLPTAGLVPTTTEKGKGVRLREFWSKDEHVVWVPSGRILLEEKNPYPWLPYVMFRGLPMPGRFWPDGMATSLRPQQIHLNKIRSQIAEHAARTSNPVLLRPSTMDPDWEWLNLPGEEVVYQNNGNGATDEPHFLVPPELSMTVQNEVDRTLAALSEQSGQHEVSAGQVPQGVTAASAISLLQEQDDTRLGPDIAEMENAIADAGKRELWLMKTYYSDERHLRIAGEGGRWDVLAFKGDKFGGVEDIDVQAGSGMPQSKAAKQSAIQQTMNLLLQNPQNGMSQRDWSKVLADFEVGGLENFFASLTRDEAQVNDENRRMANGEQLPINSYDNDEAHVAFHTDFQKSAGYYDLDPQMKLQFEEHVQAHRERLMPPPMEPAPADAAATFPPMDPAASPDPSGNGGPPMSPSPPAPTTQ